MEVLRACLAFKLNLSSILVSSDSDVFDTDDKLVQIKSENSGFLTEKCSSTIMEKGKLKSPALPQTPEKVLAIQFKQICES